MIMQGCIGVEFRRVENDLTVETEGKNTPVTASATCKNGIDVSASQVLYNGHVETVNLNKDLNVTFGIVCSIKEGYAVLCASNGELITINNKYLIVKTT